ncbi:MAG TPA: DNA primase [Candidatus Sulfotelmatobacter sp.]|nr:DNA primase [Candidatus Sulfotelmatobacter sp.]
MSTAANFAQDLKQQADIVRVISDYIQLKKAGAQNFTGLCPFHKEKSPSFSVHATRQFYHCFGCAASGDVFSFVQKIENISFPEAIRRVAEKMGIPVPRQNYSGPGEAADAKQRGVLLDLHEKACAFFEEQLRRPDGARAREYLAGRGLDDQTLRRFRIGFAPDSGFLLRDRLRGMTDEEMLRASGLMSWKESVEASGDRVIGSSGEGKNTTASALYSKFRNRVMFPICNEQGKVIAFTGRTLDVNEKSGPKYLNSPETPIYSKGRVLFNLDKAKDAVRHLGYAILVEGNVDCISVFMAGFQNVIATSGTAFSESQVRLLGRFTKQVVVNFDPDTAGAAATERSLSMLIDEEFDIKVMTLEAGFDPDLFIRRKGVKAYADAIMEAPKYFPYLISRAATMFPVKTPEGKAKAVNYLLPYIKRVPQAIVRDDLANQVAQRLSIDSALVRQELRHAATNRSAQFRSSADPQVSDAEKIVIRLLAPGVSAEVDELRSWASDVLTSEGLVEGLPAQSLLEWLLSPMEGSSGSESDQRLLAQILMQESDELTHELVESAVEALRRRKMERRKRELSTNIADAERKNDIGALSTLLQEKLAIERALRQ